MKDAQKPDHISLNTLIGRVKEGRFVIPDFQREFEWKPSDIGDLMRSKRQRTIQDAIESLLVKQRLDLPPVLRELDLQVEQIELRLRQVIQVALGDDVALVTSGIAEKVDERLQRALKKNAAMDAEYYALLAGQLEYFDLRELQATITNKLLWSRFSERFSTAEGLAIKFDQLAELRNAIRHSRTVDQIAIKEGEAAILWFSRLLQ
jgi:hypothetical protein